MTISSASVLRERLHQRLGPEALTGEASAFPIAGRIPAVVAAPATAEEVAACLETATELGAAVAPWGGGSHMALGLPPTRYDLALDLRRLDGVIEYEPADLTVTVEAGLRLADLQRRLAEEGQWLPLDPACAPEATIGGILAANASGPARIAHGSGRDLVIGMSVALADGSIAKSGGRVVKNVAGYDMAKLHIGALGTLGVILRASLKVKPIPALTRTIAARGEIEPLRPLTRALGGAGLSIDGLALTNRPGSAWRLLTRLAGSAAAVDRSHSEASRLAGEVGLAVEEEADGNEVWTALAALIRPQREDATVVKASVQPSQIDAVVAEAARLGGAVVAYPRVGVAQVAWEAASAAEAIESLRGLCVAAGGALVIEAAPAELRAKVDVWGAARPDGGLMRRLKHEFDPTATLNPGRFVGGI